jgi:YaiO family outer membrane protein
VVGLLFCIQTLLYASTIESQLKEARDRAVSKNFKGAIEGYDSILKEEPGNIAALNGKARTLAWMGEYDEAGTLYNEALSREPYNIESVTGLADIYAWEKQYGRAIELLEKLLQINPEDKEILIRLARYNLWAHEKDRTIYYSEKALKNDSRDIEAAAIKKQALSLYKYEYYTGYYHLNINDNVDGNNVYAGVLYKPHDTWTAYVRFDYLDRFNEVDGKVLAGGSLSLKNKLIMSAEAGFAPGAEIYPRISGWVELAYPVIPSLVLYSNLNLSEYRDANLSSVSFAGEYYPADSLSVLMRYTLSKTEFDTGRDSADEAIYLKITRFGGDNNNIHVYYSHGNEAFKIDTIDRIGGARAATYGIGGVYFITPAIGIAPGLEFQDREKGTEYLQLGLELKYRM